MKCINKYSFFFILHLMLFFAGCKKVVNVALPANRLTTEIVFSDSSNATAAVMGLYLKMIGSPFQLSISNGAITIYTGLSGDELKIGIPGQPSGEFYTNSIAPESSLIAQLWKEAYQIIFQANACIEGITGNNKIPVAAQLQLLAEARTIRAFIYFNMIQLFGNIPFVESTNYEHSANLPEMSYSEILRKIEFDLKESIQFLPNKSPGTDRIRLSTYSARSLLSRLYLYMSEWNKAIEEASAVIDSGEFELNMDLDHVFLKESTEAIWQLRPIQEGYETAEGFHFVPYSPIMIPNYVLTPELVASFEASDQRLQKWTQANNVNGQILYYPFKYKLSYDGNTIPSESYVVFRLAEQYLIRGEARARLNILLGNNSAESDLNAIRFRAGLGPTSSITQSEFLSAFEKERRTELFAEWGNRWYDMKRLGLINDRLSNKPGWQVTDSIYPIPLREIQANPLLNQNAGY